MKEIITIVFESKNEEDCKQMIEFRDEIRSGEFQRELKKDGNDLKVTVTCNIIK